MATVTYAFDVTDRVRASDGTYRFGTVSVTLPVDDDTDDHAAHHAAFHVAYSTYAEPCDGMILASRFVSARV